MSQSTLSLFGGNASWKASDWTSSDDSVRGGKSESHFIVEEDNSHVAAVFGHLDIKTLGGAGFASQRTTGDLNLDLSAYDGIQMIIAGTDSKTWTLNLKDSLLPTSDNGREQASISWEYEFSCGELKNYEAPMIVTIPWSDFKPTYRGRAVKDAAPLNLKDIKRLGLMVRSFYGSQEGSFCKRFTEIRAYKDHSSLQPAYPYRDEPSFQPKDDDEVMNEKAAWMEPKSRSFFCCF